MEKILYELALTGEDREKLRVYLTEIFSAASVDIGDKGLNDLPLIFVLLLFVLREKVVCGGDIEKFKEESIRILIKNNQG